MWMVGGSFAGLVLSYVGAGDPKQVVRFDSKYIYLLSHLANLGISFFISLQKVNL